MLLDPLFSSSLAMPRPSTALLSGLFQEPGSHFKAKQIFEITLRSLTLHPLHCAFSPYEKYTLSLEWSMLNCSSYRSKKSPPVNLLCCMGEFDPCFLNDKPSVLEPSGFALIPDG